MSPKPRVLVIVGPTASGKTDLALHLAIGKKVSLISADSRQVYEGLDIITGKDIPSGFKKENDYYTDGLVRLFGFDLIKADETMNAAEYSARMRAVVSSQVKEGRRVIIVGGTGFYLKALVGPENLAAVAPDEKLRLELDRLPVEELQQRLKEIDLMRFTAMNQSDVHNPRRLIRAIEVASSPPTKKIAQENNINYHWIGIRLPLDQIKHKIEDRVGARLDGAIKEAEILLGGYPDRSLPIYTSLGLEPILMYLDGKISRQKVIELWTIQEVQYARRQLTWFKKQPSIIWYDQEEVKELSLDKI